MNQPGQTEKVEQVRKTARWVISIAALGYLGFKINWPSFFVQLLRADLAPLLLAIMFFGVTYALAALRWMFLLRVQAIRLPFKVIAALTLIGQFFNSFMLGSIGGDIAKIAYIQKFAPNRKPQALFSIVIDRILGLFVLLSASLIVLAFQRKALMQHGMAPVMIIFFIVFFAFICCMFFVLFLPFERLPTKLREFWNRIPYHHYAEQLVQSFRDHTDAAYETLAALIVAVVLTSAMIAAGCCIAEAIHLQISYVQMLIIMTVVICIISLPISIGGHGLREGGFILMFAALGVAGRDGKLADVQEAAVLFSFLFYSIPLIWSFVGAIVFLLFKPRYASGLPIEAE